MKGGGGVGLGGRNLHTARAVWSAREMKQLDVSSTLILLFWLRIKMPDMKQALGKHSCSYWRSPRLEKAHNHQIFREREAPSPHASSHLIGISSETGSVTSSSQRSLHLPLMTAAHQSRFRWKHLVVVWQEPLHFKSTFDVSLLFFQATHASVVLWKTQTLRQY